MCLDIIHIKRVLDSGVGVDQMTEEEFKSHLSEDLPEEMANKLLADFRVAKEAYNRRN